MKLNLYTKLYKEAAKKLKLKYELFNDHIIYIKKRNKKISFIAASFGQELYINHRIAKSKELTKRLLKEKKMPIFEGKVFEGKDFQKIKKYAEYDIEYPVVVKPLNQMCGKGITTNVKLEKKLLKAVRKAEVYSKRILIEKHYSGDDYRFLICKGKLLCVTLRKPTFVIADGKSRVRDLIKKRNKKTKFPYRLTDHNVSSAIKSQNLTINSVPKKGRKVTIYNLANIHAGGTPTNIPLKKVHISYKKIALNAVEAAGLNLCGVDILSNDIAKPQSETKAGITELNPFPAIEIHMESKDYPIQDIAEKIIKLLFK